MKHAVRKYCSCFCMLLFLLTGCRSEEAILENLSENNANQVLVALFQHDITAHKVALKTRQGTSYQVMVAKKNFVKALQILLENELPTKESLDLKDVFPPGQSGVIPTKSEEMARLILAQKGEVENMLKSLPSVMNAKVVVNLDNPNIFKEAPKKSASVALILREENVDKQQLNDEVKHLVKTALGPIDYDDINVVIKTHKLSWQPKHQEEPQEKEASSKNIPLLIVLGLTLLAASFGLYRVYSLKKTLKALSSLTT